MNLKEAEKVVVVGALSYDNVSIVEALPETMDEKIHALHSYKAIGGGGGNVAILLKELEKIFHYPVHVDLFAKLGRAENDYTTRIIAKTALQGVHLEDMVAEQAFRISENVIISHPGGRLVVKADQNQTAAVDYGVSEQLQRSLHGAKYLVLQTNYPDVAEMAARYAKEAAVPIIIDYSIGTPSKAVLDETLKLCDYILAPGESRLSGMTQNSPTELFDRLVAETGAPFVSVSNGKHPVKTRFNGTVTETRIPSVTTVDQLGTGDTRTALFVFFLLRGDSPLSASEKASAIATLSVQYPGREWLAHVPELVRTNRLFANDRACLSKRPLHQDSHVVVPMDSAAERKGARARLPKTAECA